MGINFNNMDVDMKRLFDKYSIFTDGNDSMSIDYLAAAVSVPFKTALAELQMLVGMGYFGRDAYIDYVSKRLILRSSPAGAGAGSAAQSAPDFNAADIINTVKNTVVNNIRSGSAAAAKAAGKQDKKSEGGAAKAPPKPKSVISKKPYITRGKLTALLIIGCIVTLSSLSTGLIAIESLVYGYFFADEWSSFLIGAFIGIGLLVIRHNLAKRNSHFIAYRTIIGTKGYISIDDLADAAGLKHDTVKKDLQKFIEKGLMGKEAYIDHGDDFLVLSHSAYDNDNPAAKAPDKAQEAAAEEDDASVAKEAEGQYYSIIKEVRELNAEITDASVSARIDKIEEVTAKIFRTVEDKPEKLPQIKSFMSYYLPTTLKLLHSYATLEKQGVAGENIDSAKQNIERVLDNVVKGFTQQLDLLFKSDYLDISTDIEVLESMMAKDGLSGGSIFQTE